MIGKKVIIRADILFTLIFLNFKSDNAKLRKSPDNNAMLPIGLVQGSMND